MTLLPPNYRPDDDSDGEREPADAGDGPPSRRRAASAARRPAASMPSARASARLVRPRSRRWRWRCGLRRGENATASSRSRARPRLHSSASSTPCVRSSQSRASRRTRPPHHCAGARSGLSSARTGSAWQAAVTIATKKRRIVSFHVCLATRRVIHVSSTTGSAAPRTPTMTTKLKTSPDHRRRQLPRLRPRPPRRAAEAGDDATVTDCDTVLASDWQTTDAPATDVWNAAVRCAGRWTPPLRWMTRPTCSAPRRACRWPATPTLTACRPRRCPPNDAGTLCRRAPMATLPQRRDAFPSRSSQSSPSRRTPGRSGLRLAYRSRAAAAETRDRRRPRRGRRRRPQ